MSETILLINFQHIRDRIFDIGRNLKIVEELILGTQSYKNGLVVAGLCNKINKGYKIYIDTDSNDSDLDNSYYAEDSEEVASIELYDTTAMIDADRTTKCAIVDIEIIEENNNGQSNNFDYIESYEKKEEYPLPGCSKDINKNVNSKFNIQFEEEAVKIYSLLPQMKYENIFTTLCKNSNAENRVLLTLWDLLPNKRPKEQRKTQQFPTIKKVVGNNTVKNDDTIFQIQNMDEDIEILSDDNLENDLINPFDIKLLQRKEKAVFEHKTACQIPNKILQPPKLILNKNSSATPKDMLKCTKKYDGNGSKNRTLLSTKNVFEQNLTNNFGEYMNKYMQYLQFVQKAKSKSWKHFNFISKNSIRQTFLSSKFQKPYIKPSQFIKKNNKLKIQNVANTPMLKYDSYLHDSNDNILGINSFEQLNKKMSNKQNQSRTVAKVAVESSAPTQIFEGVKRKECIQKEIVLSSKDEEVFQSLKFLFPEINEDYMKDLCLEYSEKYDDGIQMLAHLEDYIIAIRDQSPIRKEEKIAEQQTILANIFTNADETYLRKMVQCMKGDEKAVSDYIDAQCKNPTYITKEEVSRRIKIRGQHKKYEKNFDVRMFLEAFPNAFEHFENPGRKCQFNESAYKFLKLKFKHIEENVLHNYYKRYNYNLTLSAQALETADPVVNPSVVNYGHIAYDNIPLLQECAFIENKVQIRNCMNMIREDEIKEFEKLKKNNELLECECCCDPDCMPSRCFTCSDGHIFCKSCMKKGIEVRLAEGDTRIVCFLTCKGEFSYSSLKKALSPTEFSFLLNKQQEVEVIAAGIEGLVSCPFCPFASIPPSEDKIFRCFNPDCMKQSCRLCKKLNHIPSKCYEENNEKARLLLEEKMTEAIIRKCKSCSRQYFKTSGCNKITCPCGVCMCYICDVQIFGYEHFNNGDCPLYSDDQKLHNDTVNAVANATLQYIAVKDPNVRIEALGTLSKKTSIVVPDANVSVRGEDMLLPATASKHRETREIFRTPADDISQPTLDDRGLSRNIKTSTSLKSSARLNDTSWIEKKKIGRPRFTPVFVLLYRT
ncbi:uncharacterized protein LOC117228582 isoform X1 [Megalopta genalis]|uniref:uncharacterized protein LOC117228582 isoform X1 n=2 Tax=Megalopta genalis TaxID=115081 RepID=UPI003FD24130